MADGGNPDGAVGFEDQWTEMCVTVLTDGSLNLRRPLDLNLFSWIVAETRLKICMSGVGHAWEWFRNGIIPALFAHIGTLRTIPEPLKKDVGTLCYRLFQMKRARYRLKELKAFRNFQKRHDFSNDTPHMFASLGEDGMDLDTVICENCREILTDEDYKKCQGCKLAAYCSKACQKQHWSQHKHECKQIQ